MLDLAALPQSTFMGRIARLPLRMIPRNLAVPILQGPLRGRRWIVGAHRHVCWLGSYERSLQKAVAEHLVPGSTFYDVGANVGFYTLLGSKLVRTGKVFAFEPLPMNLEFLRRHIALNSCTNVKVVGVAVSDATGLASFQTDATRAMGRLQDDGDCQVRTATLDQMISDGTISPPDFVKMDIEGAEFRALQGAKACFQRYKPTLFLATHGRQIHAQCCRLLADWGFHISPIEVGAERAEILASPR